MSRNRILVCDDEPHIVHVVASKLRNAGLDVTTAADGQEALESALNNPPNLIFTDYQMPFLSGLELCSRLAGDERTRSIPVVMLTARGYSLPEGDLAQPNIRKVLVKPFSPREVLQVALSLLQIQHAVAEV